MSTTCTPQLLFGELKVGDRLPALRHQVTATTVVLGALASRDWRPMHHDKEFAVNRNGTPDIFINTPNNAAWFERYITDFWTTNNDELFVTEIIMRVSRPGKVVHRQIKLDEDDLAGDLTNDLADDLADDLALGLDNDD